MSTAAAAETMLEPCRVAFIFSLHGTEIQQYLLSTELVRRSLSQEFAYSACQNLPDFLGGLGSAHLAAAPVRCYDPLTMKVAGTSPMHLGKPPLVPGCWRQPGDHCWRQTRQPPLAPDEQSSLAPAGRSLLAPDGAATAGAVYIYRSEDHHVLARFDFSLRSTT